MILTLGPDCASFDDYLSRLNARYRKSVRGLVRKVEKAGCTVEPLRDVGAHAGRLHELYMDVHREASIRPVTITPDYLPRLAAEFGEDFACTIVRHTETERILGFVTTLKDGDTAVAYYIGFDRAENQTVPIYFRLLYAVVEDAIRLGCQRISFGRTALEPKAKLGAQPVPLRCWVRHRLPLMNLVVRRLLQAVPHDEAPERHPFK